MPQTGLHIIQDLIDEMLAEADASPQREICGLLLGEGRTVSTIQPCTNVASDPAQAFEIDPAQLIAAHRTARAGGQAVIGHYHSHPNGRVEPSDCDRAMIGAAGEIWIIIASGSSRAFVTNPDQASFTELTLNGLESPQHRGQ